MKTKLIAVAVCCLPLVAWADTEQTIELARAIWRAEVLGLVEPYTQEELLEREQAWLQEQRERTIRYFQQLGIEEKDKDGSR